MQLRVTTVAAAVAAALGASTGAYALNPTGTGAAQVQLVVAGSSAIRAAVVAEFTSLCADALDAYGANSATAPSPDLRAFSCTFKAVAPVPATLQGKTAALYYRGEGGSVWGVEPVARTHNIKRLLVDSNCTNAGAGTNWSCAVTGYSLVSDSAASGNIIGDAVQLGVTDVEPSLFINENFPNSSVTTALGAAPATPFPNTGTKPALAQAFGIVVNKNTVDAGVNGLTNLSKHTISNIFTGLYSDWNQVPKDDGSGPVATVSVPIKVCRRDAGSGTQVATSLYFNGQGCNPKGAQAFAVPNNINVFQNNSTGAMLSCVDGKPGAIGFANYTTAVGANTHFVSINNSPASFATPLKVQAAAGNYDFWVEAQYYPAASLAGDPLTLANDLVSASQKSTTLPVNDNAIAIPILGTNVPVFPVDATRPIAIGTRGGNSCKPPAEQMF